MPRDKTKLRPVLRLSPWRFHFPSRVLFRTRSAAVSGIAAHPMSPTWPKQMLSTVTFDDLGKRTRVTVSWLPLEASELENKTFDAGRDGMKTGWGGTLDHLAAYLGGK